MIGGTSLPAASARCSAASSAPLLIRVIDNGMVLSPGQRQLVPVRRSASLTIFAVVGNAWLRSAAAPIKVETDAEHEPTPIIECREPA